MPCLRSIQCKNKEGGGGWGGVITLTVSSILFLIHLLELGTGVGSGNPASPEFCASSLHES